MKRIVGGDLVSTFVILCVIGFRSFGLSSILSSSLGGAARAPNESTSVRRRRRLESNDEFSEKLRHRRIPIKSIMDGNKEMKESSLPEFEHSIELSPNVVYHWNDISSDDKSWKSCLVHTADTVETVPGWIALGFYDTYQEVRVQQKKRHHQHQQQQEGDEPVFIPPVNSNPEQYPIMIGSDAVIGVVSKGDVSKYSLEQKDVNGVVRMGEEHQSLMESEVKRDGLVTRLTFRKLIVEDGDDEVRVREEGKNVLLYAVGAPDPTGLGKLGYHTKRGVFTLDLSSNDNNDVAEEADLCRSGDADYLHEMQVTPDLKVHYDLDVWSDSTPPSLAIKLEYTGTAWLGFGLSSSRTSDGTSAAMLGSEAVIGRPDLTLANGEKPLKYELNGKSVGGVRPMDQSKQTLKDAFVTQRDGKTILSFSKRWEEPGEITIEPNAVMSFIYAIGHDNALSHHKERGSFQVVLSKCQVVSTSTSMSPSTSDGESSSTGTTLIQPPPTHNTRASHKKAWIAHGLIASLAWLFLTPLAISTAWFRSFVPSTWIYVHVFSNVSAFLLTVLTFFIALITLATESPRSANHFTHHHHIGGLILLILVTFQAINGFLRPPVEKKSSYAIKKNRAGMNRSSGDIWHYFLNTFIPHSSRQWWKMVHRMFGLLLLVFGFHQVGTGLDLFRYHFGTGDNEQSTGILGLLFFGYIGLFFTSVVLLKIWLVCDDRKGGKYERNNNNGPDHRRNQESQQQQQQQQRQQQQQQRHGINMSSVLSADAAAVLGDSSDLVPVNMDPR